MWILNCDLQAGVLFASVCQWRAVLRACIMSGACMCLGVQVVWGRRAAVVGKCLCRGYMPGVVGGRCTCARHS